MDFGYRLKYFRIKSNMTQQELASAIDVTSVCVGNWERGVRKPTLDALVAISATLKVSIDTLVGASKDYSNQHILSENEQMLLDNYNALDSYGKKAVNAICMIEKQRVDAISAKSKLKSIELHKPRERFIPHYTTPSAAGINIPLDGTDFEMMLVDNSVPEEADYAVDIQGDSMSPYIHDGEMVYVKKDVTLQIGDIGIFCVDGAMYCKQYYIDNNRNLILVSLNPELKHTNIFIPSDSGSSVKCCGKVLLKTHIDLPQYLFE